MDRRSIEELAIFDSIARATGPSRGKIDRPVSVSNKCKDSRIVCCDSSAAGNFVSTSSPSFIARLESWDRPVLKDDVGLDNVFPSNNDRKAETGCCTLSFSHGAQVQLSRKDHVRTYVRGTVRIAVTSPSFLIGWIRLE